MITPLEQHQTEISANRGAWEGKPLLREIYAGFYRRILAEIDLSAPGLVLEIGSGMGNLKTHLPAAICTDLFPNPWLDLVCDGYELPFASESVSHLILFDVWHHLEAPFAFLREAARVLGNRGRVIILDPCISWMSLPVYGLFHHEPVGLGRRIAVDEAFPRPRAYHAAQGNATRMFFGKKDPALPSIWRLERAHAFASFAYLLSGGFSKPSLYPAALLASIQRLDELLSQWPRIFAARCVVTLSKQG